MVADRVRAAARRRRARRTGPDGAAVNAWPVHRGVRRTWSGCHQGNGGRAHASTDRQRAPRPGRRRRSGDPRPRRNGRHRLGTGAAHDRDDALGRSGTASRGDERVRHHGRCVGARPAARSRVEPHTCHSRGRIRGARPRRPRHVHVDAGRPGRCGSQWRMRSRPCRPNAAAPA
jgi:hypothetical protein